MPPGKAGRQRLPRPPHRRLRRRGFTLIEMLVVLTIVAILAGAAVPLQQLLARRLQEQALREALRHIRSALDAHRDAVLAQRIAAGPDGTPWPASLAVLERGVPLLDAQGQPQRDGPRLYLLRKLPRDPFADPALAAAQTWALRASTSPPEAPVAGADVFDIASRASGTALDGSRYSAW